MDANTNHSLIAFFTGGLLQMAENDEAVRLTIRRRTGPPPAHPVPLENVVLTRWPAADVDWNGSEVLL